MKWISSQQSLVLACWVLPLDTTLMLSAAGAIQCQMLFSLALGSLSEATSDPQFVPVPLGSAASGVGLVAL